MVARGLPQEMIPSEEQSLSELYIDPQQHKHRRRAQDQEQYTVESELSSEKDEKNLELEHKQKKKNIVIVAIKKISELSGIIVENEIFQYFILTLIVINAIMMGIGTADFITENQRNDEIFTKVDEIFLIIFTVELILEFLHRGFHLFKEGWLVFDFVTVVTSWSFTQFQVIRSFRVFRALRLIARIQVLKNLIEALLSVLPRVGAIITLMNLVFYIFAVMFTSLFKDLDLEYNYFRRLDWTFLSLFQMMTLDWAEIARDVMKEASWAVFPIVIFILISSFIVYNLIVAVLCDAIFVLSAMKVKENESEYSTGDEDESNVQLRIDDLQIQLAQMREDQKAIHASLHSLALTLNEIGVVKNVPARKFK